jgi:HAD superfamily hydrolase (TIGR01509 family)
MPRADGAVRAVLFDMDGVLVDSFEVWLGVVNATARRFGHPEVTRERLLAIFGQGIADDMRNLYPGRSRDEILAAYDEAMPGCLARITVNPEAADSLALLRTHGVRRAVVTNSQTSIAGSVLRLVGLEAHLDTWTGVSGGLKEKPAPDLLLHALRVLGTKPQDALMVGDTDYDEEAAKAAGTRFLRYEIRKGTSLKAALALAVRLPEGTLGA